jgi:hypothetical protein
MKKEALAKYLSESILCSQTARGDQAKEILNLLPFDKALQIYKEGATA